MTTRSPRAQGRLRLLPGKAQLEREFLAGASYADLARKYGVGRPETVLSTMKRRARRDGTPWPLQKSHRRLRSANRWDGITAMMIKAEINEAVENLGITKREISRRSGVGERTVYEISTGTRTRIARATAEKIMSVIEQFEHELSEPAGTTAA